MSLSSSLFTRVLEDVAYGLALGMLAYMVVPSDEPLARGRLSRFALGGLALVCAADAAYSCALAPLLAHAPPPPAIVAFFETPKRVDEI